MHFGCLFPRPEGQTKSSCASLCSFRGFFRENAKIGNALRQYLRGMKYDVIVLGSGPGGYVTAIRASQLGLKTAVVEREALGGICLNWGCIPTKALLKSANVFEYIEHANDYGIKVAAPKADFGGMVERSRGVADGMSKGVTFLMKKKKVVLIPLGSFIILIRVYLLFASEKVRSFPLDLERRQTYLFFDMTPRNFNVLIAGIVVMILVGLFLTYTKIGKAMRAVRDSGGLSRVLGVNSDVSILVTWITSSMLAGLAGIFQGIINDVRWNMGFIILLLIFAGTVLGGIGTSFGAMVGGFIIGILVQVSVGLSFMEGHYEAKNAVALAIMIVILLFRPQGIFGTKERIS